MRKTDYILLTLTILAISMSSIALFTSEKDNRNIDNSLSSVVEISSWDNDLQTVKGTGFIMHLDESVVITNCHVIFNTAKYSTYSNIQSKFSHDINYYNMKVLCYDEDIDIAILGFSDSNDPPHSGHLTLNTSQSAYADDIYIIGNSMGYGLALRTGVVSIPEIIINQNNYSKNCIVCSVAINHGDSGAPIVNSNGEVIGMVSFRLKDTNAVAGELCYGIRSKLIEDFIKHSYYSQ